jgi:FAD/FMN-containing dehydrogenase
VIGLGDTPATEAPAAPLEKLRGRLSGALALPGEPGYARAAPWNVAVPSQQRAVVLAASAGDVAETVRFAGEHGLRVAVRRTGHGAVPLSDDTLLVHTAALDECAVEPQRRMARVGAGVVWQQVIDAAAPHGLAPLSGAAPGVGVAGLLSGGGLGPLARTYGVCSDLVRALEVVTGDGSMLRATAEEHPDLFWGLRGGKGTLGIVTAVEIDLLPLSTVYAGAVWFDGTDASAVLHAWRELTATLPDQGTTSVALVQLPELPGIPEPLAGRPTVAVRFAWTGQPAVGGELLAPIRSVATPLLDGVADIPYAAIGSVHADPVAPMPVHEDLALLRELPADLIDRLLAVAGPGTDSPQTVVELRQLGGAVAQAPRHPSAVCHRDTAFTLLTAGVPAGPDPDAVRRHAAQVMDAAAPEATGHLMPNFAASDDQARIARCYDADALHWLGRLAEQHDPAGVLNVGQVARPTSDIT